MRLKIASLILFMTIGFATFAQNDRDTYLEAKKYFDQGRYALATDLFGRVLDKENSKAYAYACFYKALSHYKLGEKNKAKDLWLELAYVQPDWKDINEVYFWLSSYYLEEGNFIGRKRYLDKISDPAVLQDAMKLEPKEEEEEDFSQTSDSLSANDSTWVKDFIYEALSDQYTPKEIASLLEIPQSELKAEYKIAVLLPFMFESLVDYQQTIRNRFVMNIYQGMTMAADQLKREGINISLYPYDTKKNAAITQDILNKKELLAMDLIIGPLYKQPIDLTVDFSKKNKVPQLNLLSTSVEGCQYPYSFYLKPSRQTVAGAIFDYVSTLPDTTKKAVIFYQKTAKDEETANAYKDLLINAGYDITLFKGLEKVEAQIIGETIGEKLEIIIHPDSTAHKDSILTYHPEIEIKTRKAYGKDEDEDYYETLALKKADIGHIMISSSDPAFGASIVSALEIRDDSILTIGNENWIDPRVINIPQLARQNVVMTNPFFVNDPTTHHNMIDTYVGRFKTYPDQNVILGYEGIYKFGKALEAYGRNFAPYLLTSDGVEGGILDKLVLHMHPDNQTVPIVKISNSKFIKVN